MKLVSTFLILFLSTGLHAQESAPTNPSSQQSCSCCTENHDDFDFWVGKWTVTDKDGNVIGHNLIEKIQENCVIKENWSGTQGNYTGTSYNFYNRSTEQWEQIWIDNQGSNLYLRGNRLDNQMVLRSTDLKDKDDNTFFHRITWTKNEDGTVRQLWETVTNESQITIAFDGLYTKSQ